MSELLAALLAAPAERRQAVLGSMTLADKLALDEDFATWGPWQQPPAGAWRTWVLMAGRGFGKTRAGAEWVHARARAGGPGLRIALVGASIEEARAVMVEGVSGLIATARASESGAMAWERTRGRLTFASGAEATLFSGAHPQRLRGFEHGAAWCDELAKWRHPRATWDQLWLGLRGGADPRAVITTTPVPGPMLGGILDEPGTVVTRGRTRDNRYLPAAYLATVEGRYRGTRLGRQELEGELIRDVEGALFAEEVLARGREAAAVGAAGYARIVVGVDPPATARGTCGIVVAGRRAADGRVLVLADASVVGPTPDQWARAVAEAVRTWGAGRVVVETNQGGEMVTAVLRAADPAMRLVPVRAAEGKAQRAVPVAAAFERGEAALAGHFAALEAELRALTLSGPEGPSPDRADAMVWAVGALLGPQSDGPRVRWV